MRYFKVTCRRGHTGKGKINYITFYIKADNLIQAMDIARSKGGVQHSRMPALCKEISRDEYIQQRVLKRRNAYTECGAK